MKYVTLNKGRLRSMNVGYPLKVYVTLKKITWSLYIGHFLSGIQLSTTKVLYKTYQKSNLTRF